MSVKIIGLDYSILNTIDEKLKSKAWRENISYDYFGANITLNKDVSLYQSLNFIELHYNNKIVQIFSNNFSHILII